MIKNVDSDSELQSLIKSHDGLVVIDFYATWCGPCKRIAPKIQQWSLDFSSVLFLKVDVDINEESAMAYDVELMPTFVFIKDGILVSQVAGANEQELLTTITKYAN